MATTTTDTTLSNQIYLSRDNIRNQIIEYMQYYLELENVDLVKSSFLSFMIDTLATLTTNVLFYASSTYKEFFLTTAQLPETIYNLSAFLGYNAKEASYSVANLLITIPLTFSTSETNTFQIPERFNFYAGTVGFQTYYETTVRVVNNSSATVTVTTESAQTYNIPVVIDTTSAQSSFSFVLPVYQYKEVIQEFQIDEDTQLYQFVTIDVPLNGKVSSMTVQVRDPGSTSWRLYDEFNSVYLMLATDYGYVSRTISTGRRLVFGNGLIGIQPLPGSTVQVTAYITEGSDGNVIPSSITTGDRMYCYSSGNSKVVNYTVTNTSPATGGEDEESIQEVRSNSIASLIALSRLVSSTDYQNAGIVMPNSPIASNTIPVLKRSDVKCNEVQLFSAIEFGSVTRTDSTTGESVTEATITPTRNEKYTIPVSQTYIGRDTVITTEDGNEYYTLFDISVDLINLFASYTYIMYSIDIVPILVTSYGIIYDLVCSNLNVSKVGNTAVFSLSYNSSEPTYDLCTAQMIVDKSLIYTLTNDPVNKTFSYTFSQYIDFPEDVQNVEFNIFDSAERTIATYSAEFTFRKTLDNFMMSNVASDGTNTIVYDIPVVLKSYYDGIVKKDFEATVLQKMMTEMDFNTYKMLTDFTNLKFVNTYGTMQNMKHNPTTKDNCIDISIKTPPEYPETGDRYIIGYIETGEWANRNNQIAQCIDSTNITWYYFTPTTDDIIYVENTGNKYIYNGHSWLLMEYQIPLVIEIELFKSPTYYGSDVELANLVKDTLLNAYSDRFGPNTTLYRSEIIRTVQDVVGVRNCNLIKPESNLFFNFKLGELTQQELLEYGPEYVYFNEDSISIQVYPA
jgi:hypothetical protein